jgi:Lipase (class 3)
MATPSFAFNTLVQPSASVTQTTPSGFDANMANLLATTTAAVVQLYAQGLTSLTTAMLDALPLVGGAASYQQIGSVFTAPEALGFGANAATASQSSSTPGAYVQVTIGLALQALDASKNPLFTVIALRGTQTYQEWVNDLTALPRSFALIPPKSDSVGYVHSGFYAVYATGTDGQVGTSTSPRVAGSLADQIYQAVTTSTWPTSVPLYVTGHSLGAALAELCAMDLALNASKCASSITMLNFAPPRVSAGFLDDGSPAFYDPTLFMTSYQGKVKSSYSVVNAADLVPIMPLTLGSSTGLQVAYYPVVPSANIVMYCAQLGDIGSNHELTLNYLPYLQALAAGFPASDAGAPARARTTRRTG